MTKPDVTSKSHVLLYILSRIEANKNFLCGIVGPTGSGKSYAGLRMCERLDPGFNIDRVVFTPIHLLKLINAGGLKKGDCVLVDESGVMQSTREWQSVSNKLLNYVFQTIRSRNLIMFFCVPVFGFLDSHARALFHGLFTTKGINLKNKQVTLNPKFIQLNTQTGKQYFKHLRLVGDWGLEPVKIFHTGLPSKKLRDEYEAKKLAYTTKMYEDIYEKLNKGKELTALQQQAFDMKKSGADVEEIAIKMGVTEREVYRKLVAARKKGFDTDDPVNSSVLA